MSSFNGHVPFGVPGAEERSLEALSKPSMNRNAFALAIISALVAGGCFGAMAADFAARSTDLGYEASSGLADSMTGALFMGGLLNVLVSLIAFANARSNAGFLAVLIFGAVCAGPVGSGIATALLPTWWNVECNQGNARACYAVKRVGDGLVLDRKNCGETSTRWDQRPCERLLERDVAGKATYCSEWKADCARQKYSGYSAKCEVATNRCPTSRQSDGPHENVGDEADKDDAIHF